jgi:3-hydroxymyristoyl/3-hydroxydecanoyl-(acyl carrier protein) dehydratase
MRFVLVDRIDRLDLGRRAEGHKEIAADEEYFRDHFPGYPIVPGVLVLESLAQLGGRLVEASVRDASGRRILPMLAKVEHAKFLHSVRPGDRLDLAVDVVAIAEDAARVTGVARVGSRKVAVAGIMYALLDVGRTGERLDPAQAAALFDWSDRVWRQIRPGSRDTAKGGAS